MPPGTVCQVEVCRRAGRKTLSGIQAPGRTGPAGAQFTLAMDTHTHTSCFLCLSLGEEIAVENPFYPQVKI